MSQLNIRVFFLIYSICGTMCMHTHTCYAIMLILARFVNRKMNKMVNLYAIKCETGEDYLSIMNQQD